MGKMKDAARDAADDLRGERSERETRDKDAA
jgi:hypothetical protein